MTVDRTHRQDELLGDLAIALALRQQGQHLKLPVGQASRITPGSSRRAAWHIRYAKLAQPSSHLPRKRCCTK
jgi:hypothetical protein